MTVCFADDRRASPTEITMPNWETMWSANGGLKPGQAFDCRRCEPAFQRLLDTATDLPARAARKALVPGCGRGYAVSSLFRAGFDAVGLDIAPTAVEEANAYLASAASEDGATFDSTKCRVVCDDFFSHSGEYDVVYDCTFLCALDPDQRVEWAKKCKALLRPDGELITLIFPVVDPPYTGGPPHCMSPELVRGLLEAQGFVEKQPIYEVPTEDLARASVMSKPAKEFVGRWIIQAP